MTRLRIVVAGLIGRHPVGGWHYLQYLAGLTELGHEVYYYEDTWCWPYHPVRKTYVDDPTWSVDYLHRLLGRYAPATSDRWHYVHLHDRSHGMTRQEFDRVARSADVFLNVGGANFVPDALSGRCIKVMIDTDPGFNQIVMSERFPWSENVDRWCESVVAHDRHFTYATNIESPTCAVPRVGLDWVPTRPPVAMEMWRDLAAAPPPPDSPWTTIMTWNPFKGPVTYRGREYGAKGPEFERLIDLPRMVDLPLAIAVGGPTAPLARLAEHGWRVCDGPETTLTPERYRSYLLNSRGELSCAKEIYVALRTGWLSERTACYLASGRPAIVQDTGFTEHVPAGSGLLAFTDAEGARDALLRVEADYEHHAHAAVAFAEDHLSARRVLGRLLDRLGDGNA